MEKRNGACKIMLEYYNYVEKDKEAEFAAQLPIYHGSNTLPALTKEVYYG
jgi:hypothetical protein